MLKCGMLYLKTKLQMWPLASQQDGVDPGLAVDGKTATCSKTASIASTWTLDLQDNYIIEEVSIHPETVSQWVSSAVASSDSQNTENIIGQNDSQNYWGKWIQVEFAKKVMVSRVDIYEWLNGQRSQRVGNIKCQADDGWETVWSTTSIPRVYNWQRFSSNLTKSCISNRIRLEVVDGTNIGRILDIDAINLHGSEIVTKSYTIEMGLTKETKEAESIMNLSTKGPAKWMPDGKGPYRHVMIKPNTQNETLKLCEVRVKGYLKPRTPYFQIVTGIAMSNPPVSTVFEVLSGNVCALICFRQTDPACMTAVYNPTTQTCALFNDFDHIKDPSNENKTVVLQFAAHVFTDKP